MGLLWAESSLLDQDVSVEKTDEEGLVASDVAEMDESAAPETPTERWPYWVLGASVATIIGVTFFRLRRTVKHRRRHARRRKNRKKSEKSLAETV